MKLTEPGQDYSLDIEESDPVVKTFKYSNLSIQKPLATKTKTFSPFKKFDENKAHESKENKWKTKNSTSTTEINSNAQSFKMMIKEKLLETTPQTREANLLSQNTHHKYNNQSCLPLIEKNLIKKSYLHLKLLVCKDIK
jgi:hypothetical protein